MNGIKGSQPILIHSWIHDPIGYARLLLNYQRRPRVRCKYNDVHFVPVQPYTKYVLRVEQGDVFDRSKRLCSALKYHSKLIVQKTLKNIWFNTSVWALIHSLDHHDIEVLPFDNRQLM